MYYNINKKFPIWENRPVSNYRQRWVVCLSVLALSVCTATFFFVAYHNHLFGLGLRCPKKSMYFKADSPNIEKILWDYATYWSNKAKNEKSFTIFLDTPADNDPDVVLDGLGETFQPLSLRPCPIPCRKNKKHALRHQRRRKTTVPPSVDDVVAFGGLPLGPLFEMDLGSEFQFREDVQNEADENIMEIMEKMMNESFDQLVTVYLSTLTPAVDDLLLKMSGNESSNSSNIRESQSAMLQSAMDSYRNVSKPLFLVLGNHSEAAGIDGDDVLKQDIPENVALAILSSSNDTIFNHGLWPTFGALLARSNVTSFAMDKNVLDAAKNASLNWTASVTY